MTGYIAAGDTVDVCQAVAGWANTTNTGERGLAEV